MDGQRRPLSKVILSEDMNDENKGGYIPSTRYKEQKDSENGIIYSIQKRKKVYGMRESMWLQWQAP